MLTCSFRHRLAPTCRRFFVDYLENDKLGSLLANEAAAKLRKWFKKQHASFVDLLCKFIASDDEWLHALSIRTLLEVSASSLLAECSMLRCLSFPPLY